MKKIICVTICVLVGGYCNAQSSAKQNTGKVVVDEKAKAQLLSNERTVNVVTPAPDAASSQLKATLTIPSSQDKQVQPTPKEALRNNAKLSPETK